MSAGWHSRFDEEFSRLLDYEPYALLPENTPAPHCCQIKIYTNHGEEMTEQELAEPVRGSRPVILGIALATCSAV